MATCIKEQPLPLAAKKSLLFVQFDSGGKPFVPFSAPVEEDILGESHPEGKKARLGRIFELLSLYK